MKRKALLSSFFVVVASMLLSLQVQAANTNKTVSQVTETVVVTANWNYVVSSATPFGESGIVNLQNTEHAVLILSKVKPSAALKLLAAHVQIAGEKAVNGTNCQVKIYSRGTIILPYGNSIKPLTVYSEQNFGGEAVNDFGLEHNGGFMNTLSAEKLNNQIRSFKLKRGYMVTFSTLPNGRGYSRCFIAAYSDVEIKTLPAVLDQKISSYRIFKWYDASKAGLANDTRKAACDALNVQSCYSFSLGEDRGIDCECVPHHIYEDWPSAADCGKVAYSPHLKTNNEPGNSADDHPQSVETILANWENLMATGMRLCSPSSHDGSLGHLRAFLDSIDARGWRCDIVDIHSYWDKSQFNGLTGWSTGYGNRPVWVSEWVWGASWNNNGIFNTSAYNRDNPGDKEYNANKSAIQEICGNMNGNDRVERYFYWNSEAPCSKLYTDAGKLTPAGEWYAQQNPGLGYKASYSYIPTTPPQVAPSKFKLNYNKTEMKATLSWYDGNGEWNRSMTIERSTDGGTTWETLATPKQQESPSTCSYNDNESRDGYKYRIHIVDLNGKDRYSATQTAILQDASTGDGVTVDGKVKYIGGNVLTNGDFELGMQGWTNGEGNAIAAPYFQLLTAGGPDEGHHLIGWASQGEAASGSLVTSVSVVPDNDYYFSAKLKNTGGDDQTVKAGGADIFKTVASAEWTLQAGSFNVGSNSEVTLSFRWLNKGRIDKLMVCRLFDTQEEAYADAVAQARLRAQAFINYNTNHNGFNAELQAVLDGVTTSDAEGLKTIEDALALAIEAYNKAYDIVPKLLFQSSSAVLMHQPGYESVVEAIETLDGYQSAAKVLQFIDEMQAAIAKLQPYEKTDGIVNPSFASSSSGWVKTSTYEGGDQRRNTVLGKNCWNAWWGVSSADAGDKQLSIEQTVQNLPEGYYTLSCVATTEHLCLSDQHAYIKNDEMTAPSMMLTSDRFDYPGIANADAWETLTTTPVYVPEGGSLNVGFESSKFGAVDGLWIPGGTKVTGDNREGWWCATDFQLNRLPVYRRNMPSAGLWSTICLPYDYKPGVGVQLYEVAGLLTEDGQDYICLEPVAEQKAGYTCVFFSETEQAEFFESGEAAKYPAVGKNNLSGTFDTDMYLFPWNIGFIAFVDGAWHIVTEEDTMGEGLISMVPKNEGYLYGRDGLTVLTSWSGVKMPLGSPSFVLGDVNGDGKVDVSDYIGVANHILNIEQEGFNERAADVDGSGTIDVSDYLGIGNIIHTGSPFGGSTTRKP